MEYPIINGDSRRGPQFIPIEKCGDMKMQMWGKNQKIIYETIWAEINGHCFSIYNKKTVF